MLAETTLLLAGLAATPRETELQILVHAPCRCTRNKHALPTVRRPELDRLGFPRQHEKEKSCLSQRREPNLYIPRQDRSEARTTRPWLWRDLRFRFLVCQQH